MERYRELTEATGACKDLTGSRTSSIAIISHDLGPRCRSCSATAGCCSRAAGPAGELASAEAIVRQGRKILGAGGVAPRAGQGRAGAASLDVQLLDVGRVARRRAFELEILAAERGVTLKARRPRALLVMGDELKLREVLQNLITNGLEHAAKSGTVVDGEALDRLDGRW